MCKGQEKLVHIFSSCGFYQNDDGKINVVHFRIFRVNDFWAPFCCFNGRVTINLGGEGWVSVFFSWGKQVSEEQSSEIALDDYGHTSNRLFHPQPGHTALIVLFYTTLSGLCSSDIVRPKSSSEEDSMGWRFGLNAIFCFYLSCFSHPLRMGSIVCLEMSLLCMTLVGRSNSVF